ncbi:uncharacterized protein LOC129586773 isoform X2 [Paramacrobiotus metropolitanus]|uniref:uncharacterized protein LOC129586773 isoform X2 n=1 Tax=Paramacrobiotus metropolitanus TaxID=2943436 RepID=UPI002446389F|nr:uncharacterized protein LOC129586773 isoform X2 [Paramacrobiotus metropolitanus]
MDRRNFLYAFFTAFVLPVGSYVSPYAVADPPCPAVPIINGRVSYKTEEKRALFTCDPGFRLFGQPTIRCRGGTWDQPAPLCYNTEPGCPPLRSMPNGYLVFQGSGKGVAFANCHTGFERLGPNVLYCNGTHWNGSLPVCRSKPATKIKALNVDSMRNNSPPLPVESNQNGFDCDFEKFDIGKPCIWVQNSDAIYRWTVHNGLDHSGPPKAVSGSYYLYARPSSYGEPSDTASLISPALPSDKGNSCLLFRYYMHGIRIRNLTVRGQEQSGVAPIWESDFLFRVNSTNSDEWMMAQVPLPSKIIRVAIEVQKGIPYSADVAIDNLRIIQSTNCPPINADLIDVAPPDAGNTTKTTKSSPTVPAAIPTPRQLGDLSTTFNNLSTIPPSSGEVNIDIYEVGNRSFVDEPSKFTLQVVQLHSATINPSDMDNRGYLGYLQANRSARVVIDAQPSKTDSTDEQPVRNVSLITGVTIGAAALTMILIATAFMIMLRRRSQCKQKPITEETEFQYFSYSNDGFREIGATLPADQVNKR